MVGLHDLVGLFQPTQLHNSLKEQKCLSRQLIAFIGICTRTSTFTCSTRQGHPHLSFRMADSNTSPAQILSWHQQDCLRNWSISPNHMQCAHSLHSPYLHLATFCLPRFFVPLLSASLLRQGVHCSTCPSIKENSSLSLLWTCSSALLWCFCFLSETSLRVM